MFRVLGIDPGSENLGYAVIDIDITKDTMPMHLFDAGAFNTDYLNNKYFERYAHLGDRLAKFEIVKRYYVELFNEYEPDIVIAEDCYLRRGFRGMPLVAPYRSLVEGLVTIRNALAEYNDTYHLVLIDAPSAKKAVGASGKGGDKDNVKKAVLALKTLSGLENATLYNEHTFDAIAITYSLAKKMQDEYRGLV